MLNRREIKLKKYIKLALDKGKKKEELEEILLKLGWDKETIKKIFDKIEKKDFEITIPFKRKKQEEPEDEEQQPKENKIKKVGIKQQLDEISETLEVITQKNKAEKKLKKKNFKLPYSVKGKLKKLAIKNKVQVMLLRRTRSISPVIGEIREGMLMVGENVYNGSVDATWLWRGKYPTMIVCEWDLQPLTPEGINKMRNITNPLSPEELREDTIKNNRSAEPQIIMIRSMEAKENKMLKKQVNVKAIVITIILTLIGAAIMFGGKIA